MIDLTSKFGRIVERHLNQEYFVWLTTVGSDLTPQPRPVWFIWDSDTILIFRQAKAHKLKHLAKHPNVALHFNTPDDLATAGMVVITGRAAIDPSVPPAHEVPAYLEKYRSGIERLGSTPEDFSRAYSVAIRVMPRSVRGWQELETVERRELHNAIHTFRTNRGRGQPAGPGHNAFWANSV